MKSLLFSLGVIFSVVCIPVIAAQSDDANVVPEVAAALAVLDEKERPKFFGAHESGFDTFQKVGDSWLLGKKLETTKKDESLVKLVFIGSLSKQRKLSDGAGYRSLVSEIDFDCNSKRFVVLHQELKDDSFGVGRTVSSIKRRGVTEASEWVNPRSNTLSEFLFRLGCSNVK